MDEIKSIVDDLEEFNRAAQNKYDFPAVTIIRNKGRRASTVSFNVKCNPLLKKNIQLKMSDNYVFFRFTDVDDRRYYRVTKNKRKPGNSYYGFRITSMHLNKASLIGKSFKLYKYKDGYLIDVRKPLRTDNEEDNKTINTEEADK